MLEKCQTMVLEFSNGWTSKKKDVWRGCQQIQVDRLKAETD
jgi:hypothetical protein